MNALRTRGLEDISRTIAIGASLIATLMFVVVFATDKQLPYQIERYLTGQEQNLGLAAYLGLLVAAFAGYLFASRQKFTTAGSLLAIGSVAAIYVFCRIGLGFFPSPLLIVIACPALFHLLALKLHRLSPDSETATAEVEPVDLTTATHTA